MKNLLVLFIALLFCVRLDAQKTPPPPPPRLVDFTTTAKGNGYQFTPAPPPLQQKAGAPEAYWTYYWEFGDGSFSFEDSPQHVFTRTGNYSPILYATAHYDDGDRPKGKSIVITADRTGIQSGGLPTVFDSTQIPIQMRAIRQARAGEEMICILSYRNLGQVRTDGRLHVFFNERRFPSSHFALDSARLYFQEKADAALSLALPMDTPASDAWSILDLPSHTGVSTSWSGDFPSSTILPTLLANARGAYREEKIWRFTDLQPGEKRNLFVALRGTDKMLQDTNAFIHVEAVFAPFDPVIPPERFELEFEIVSSHDPNAIIVSDSRVNYRFIGSKKLDYKVQFQNNGEGPASTVELKIEIPEGLDMKRVRPTEWYPKCPICPKTPTNRSCLDTLSSKEGLTFTFRNIYLPGSRQKDVDDRDSTKGFVRYKIEAERGMPKRSFRSRAKITFDKNAPIYTNFTRTRFKVGLSPGLKVGYGFEPNFDQSTIDPSTGEEQEADFIQNGYVFLGASLSPFKSWRIYPQVELLTGIKGRTDFSGSTPTVLTKVTPNTANPEFIDSTVITTTAGGSRGFVSFEVPFMIRKNFSRFIGLGIGGSGHVILENGDDKVTENTTIYTVSLFGQPNPPPVVLPESSTLTTYRDTRFRYTAFFDLTLGAVRRGLNLGLRGGTILGEKKKVVPFAQVSLELKL
jgi:hypothetical protein